MRHYPIELTPDDNGTFLVTCRCVARLHRLAQSLVVLPFLLSACQSASEPTPPNLEGMLVEQNPFKAAPTYFTYFGSKSGVLNIHCFSVNHIVDIKYERLEYF